MKTVTGFCCAAVIAAGTFMGSTAHANIIFTGSGTSAGVAVSASADFTASAGTLTIVLKNLTVHTADAGELLTGLDFTAKTGSTTITSATFSATGVERTIAGNGTFTDSGVTVLSWELNSGTTLQADFNPNAKDGIVGPADASGVYTGNGSINGNPGHNPFADQTITLTLTNPGITAATTISNVTFLYNTGLSQTIPGTPGGGSPPPSPEPASLGLLGLGAVALLARRKRA